MKKKIKEKNGGKATEDVRREVVSRQKTKHKKNREKSKP